jgi:formamidopyrimidine-DNA glycosylase
VPELPDVVVYTEHITALFADRLLTKLTIYHPFLLRSVAVPPSTLAGKRLRQVERLGKRVVLGFEGDLFAVIHLMIAGRFRVSPIAPQGGKKPNRMQLCSFAFDEQQLILTEAGTKRRASLYLVEGRAALAEFDRGGIEPLEAGLTLFQARLTTENRTLKRALTDPRLVSGIGNSYSDEILHRAQLSPVTRTLSLSTEEWARLHHAVQSVLQEWTCRLRGYARGFPEKVTAFRPEMAVHGRYGEPCPVCGTRVQRIRYAENEVNYCPTCQTDGRLLRDRALSRLLQSDWPKTVDELEELRSGKQ